MKSHAYIAILILASSAAVAQDTPSLPAVTAQADAPKSINRSCAANPGGHYLRSNEVARAFNTEKSAETDRLSADANKEARKLCRQNSVAVEFRFIRGMDSQPVAIIARDKRVGNAL